MRPRPARGPRAPASSAPASAHARPCDHREPLPRPPRSRHRRRDARRVPDRGLLAPVAGSASADRRGARDVAQRAGRRGEHRRQRGRPRRAGGARRPARPRRCRRAPGRPRREDAGIEFVAAARRVDPRCARCACSDSSSSCCGSTTKTLRPIDRRRDAEVACSKRRAQIPRVRHRRHVRLREGPADSERRRQRNHRAPRTRPGKPRRRSIRARSTGTFYMGCDYLTPNWKESLGLLGRPKAEPRLTRSSRRGRLLADRFGAQGRC